jgi:hypothetical protein
MNSCLTGTLLAFIGGIMVGFGLRGLIITFHETRKRRIKNENTIKTSY